MNVKEKKNSQLVQLMPSLHLFLSTIYRIPPEKQPVKHSCEFMCPPYIATYFTSMTDTNKKNWHWITCLTTFKKTSSVPLYWKQSGGQTGSLPNMRPRVHDGEHLNSERIWKHWNTSSVILTSLWHEFVGQTHKKGISLLTNDTMHQKPLYQWKLSIIQSTSQFFIKIMIRYSTFFLLVHIP